MAIVDLPGRGVWFPELPGVSINPALATTLLIAGANASDKIAQMGRVSFAERTGTKNITHIHFLFGAVTKSNGSTLRVSLQDVDLANGPAIRPDGTADQSVTIANADAGFVSNGYYRAALDAPRTVTYGDLLATVFDWNGGGVSGDSVAITGLSVSSAASNGGAISHQNCCALFTAAAWGIITMATNILLEFDDGTFGSLDGSYIVSALGSASVNTGTTPDERALEFQVPYNCEIDGIWALINVGAGDVDLVLYDGTTPLATSTLDANAIQATGVRFIRATFPKVALTANTTYRVAVKPTTATNITFYYRDVGAAAHRQAIQGGTALRYNERTDAGAWGAGTDTRIPWLGVRISGIDVDPPSITNLNGGFFFAG